MDKVEKEILDSKFEPHLNLNTYQKALERKNYEKVQSQIGTEKFCKFVRDYLGKTFLSDLSAVNSSKLKQKMRKRPRLLNQFNIINEKLQKIRNSKNENNDFKQL